GRRSALRGRRVCGRSPRSFGRRPLPPCARPVRRPAPSRLPRARTCLGPCSPAPSSGDGAPHATATAQPGRGGSALSAAPRLVKAPRSGHGGGELAAFARPRGLRASAEGAERGREGGAPVLDAGGCGAGVRQEAGHLAALGRNPLGGRAALAPRREARAGEGRAARAFPCPIPLPATIPGRVCTALRTGAAARCRNPGRCRKGGREEGAVPARASMRRAPRSGGGGRGGPLSPPPRPLRRRGV